MDKRKDNLIRAFICIDFPDEIIKEIARMQEEVEKIKFKGKLTEIENLHLTLKFLGEIDESKVEVVKEKLKEIKFEKMNLKLGESGTFNVRGNPRIVWVKVLGEKIWELQKKIDEKMNEIGFQKEERFMSHLTIARVKYVDNKEKFKDKISKVGIKEINFSIESFKLMKSDLRLLGPVYTLIEEYPLM